MGSPPISLVSLRTEEMKEPALRGALGVKAPRGVSPALLWKFGGTPEISMSTAQSWGLRSWPAVQSRVEEETGV